MPETKGPVDVELWIAINEDGDYAVTTDESVALETLANEQGGWHARVIKITVRGVELPGQDAVEIPAPPLTRSVELPQATDATEGAE